MSALLDRLRPTCVSESVTEKKPDGVKFSAEKVNLAVSYDTDVPSETITRMNNAFAAEFAASNWVTTQRES